MKLPFSAMVVGLLAALADGSAAHEFTAGQLVIEHPYALETPATARTGAGYMSIVNHGDRPDRLIAVRADFPSVTLHVTEVDASGVARMRALDAVEIPADGAVTLEPKGAHVMFMGLTGPLVAGDRIAATLVFETAGEVPVVFNVEPRKAGGSDAGHDGMDMTH